MNMKKIFIFAVFIGLFGTICAQETLQQANEVYTQGDFARAVESYQQTLAEKSASAEVYYNLGNCYYRLNQIAPAILNYERALLLDPGDGDIRFNLEIARLKTVDKIEPAGEFFLTTGYNAVKNLCGADSWSHIGIVCFLLLLAALALFLFSRKISLKKIGFYAGMILLVFTIFANTFAYNQKQKLIDRNTAIIFAPTVTIKSAPDASGTDLFILHEGTKVLIKSQLGEWQEIETADGNVGWILSKDMEVI
jgi:hypothetical protein